MNFTNNELIHLIGITHVDLCGLKGTIEDYEEIIDDSTNKKEDPKFIQTCLNSLELFKQTYKENTFLKERLIKQFYSQGGKEEQI